ncbi:MAG: FadR/GntR family transcriptional regulator [Spirochaetia bacterium]|jgi:DNA-binding FadR family transcriptional regulator|nr:FadR/GntR family transcriptional regulator [Spirochaetia bacterium]
MIVLEEEDFLPIKSHSLKDVFIERFEALILSGKFSPGDRVPSERDLGVLFGISRPVVHEGLRALESRGLVTIESRKGVRVNDYRKEGSIEMLLSLLNYSGGKLSQSLFDGILEMRILFEVETAGLAAKRRSDENLSDLLGLLQKEGSLGTYQAREVSDLDFEFHVAIAIASGNQIYPLLMNSFKKIYKDILEDFYADVSVIEPVFSYHRVIVASISEHDELGARSAMRALLRYSETNLRRILFGQRAPAL